MSKKIRTEAVDHLFEAILSLKNKKNVIYFLKMYAPLTSFFLYPNVLRLLKC